MNVLFGVARESLALFLAMSPYLLLGFLFAGLMHVLFSLDSFVKHLGKSNLKSIFKSVLIGIPLPLCSCGVIPAAMLLKKKGASNAAVLSFLVATPITGIDSIFATYSLLGAGFAVFRVLASGITALFAGAMAILFLPSEENRQRHVHRYPPIPTDPDCCHLDAARRNMTRGQKVRELFRYAFVDILGDVWKWLLLGVIIGGAISYFVPEDIVVRYLGNTFLSMIIMLVIGVPMYVCSTGSIPIAAALMLKGMSPGAALVFLLAGPAVNAVSITVITKEMGKKAVVIYVGSIAVMSLIMGYLLNFISLRLPFEKTAMMGMMEMLPYWFDTACGIVLTLMIIYIVYRENFKKDRPCCKK